MSDGQTHAEMLDKNKITEQFYNDGEKWRPATHSDIDDPDIFTCKEPPELIGVYPHEVVVTNTDLKLLHDAIMGQRGTDQTRIGRVGLKWLTTLLKKNHDYESSAWEEPILVPGLTVGDSILVRMSDKVKRLRSLRGKKNEISDESYNDTMGDLGSYALLYLARPEQ